MAKLYLVNTLVTPPREYLVVSRDLDAGTITLSAGGATFTEKFDAARFKQLGYERKIVDDAPPPGPSDDDEDE